MAPAKKTGAKKAAPKKKRGTAGGKTRQKPPDAPSTAARWLDPQRELWYRQDEETEAAYAAFRAYKDLGDDRSLRLVAKEVGKAVSLVERWSVIWSWRIRAAEWDRELERKAAEVRFEEARQVAARQAQQAASMLDALTAPARALIAKLADEPQLFAKLLDQSGPDGLLQVMGMIVQASRYLPAVAEMERLVTGASDAKGAMLSGLIDPEDGAPPESGARELLGDPEATRLAVELFNRMHGVKQLSSGKGDG